MHSTASSLPLTSIDLSLPHRHKTNGRAHIMILLADRLLSKTILHYRFFKSQVYV